MKMSREQAKAAENIMVYLYAGNICLEGATGNRCRIEQTLAKIQQYEERGWPWPEDCVAQWRERFAYAKACQRYWQAFCGKREELFALLLDEKERVILEARYRTPYTPCSISHIARERGYSDTETRACYKKALRKLADWLKYKACCTSLAVNLFPSRSYEQLIGEWEM
jgi:hypothetical protein